MVCLCLGFGDITFMERYIRFMHITKALSTYLSKGILTQVEKVDEVTKKL